MYSGLSNRSLKKVKEKEKGKESDVICVVGPKVPTYLPSSNTNSIDERYV